MNSINPNAQINKGVANSNGKIENDTRRMLANLALQLSDTSLSRLDGLRQALRDNNGRADLQDFFGSDGELLVDIGGGADGEQDGLRTGNINDSSNANTDVGRLKRILGEDGKLTASDIHKIKDSDGKLSELAAGKVNDANYSPVKDDFYTQLAELVRTGGQAPLPSFLTNEQALNTVLGDIETEENNQSRFSVSKGTVWQHGIRNEESYLFYRNNDTTIDYQGDTVPQTMIIAHTKDSNGFGVSNARSELFVQGNHFDFDAFNATVSVNGNSIDLKTIPNMSSSTLTQAFSGLFADLDPKPTVEYHGNGVYIFKIENTDTGENIRAGMASHGAIDNRWRGVSYTIEGSANIEGTGAIVDPHGNQEAYNINDNPELLATQDILTKEELEQERADEVISSPEFAQATEDAEEQIANGSLSDLATTLNSLDKFGKAANTTRGKVIAELVNRHFESGGTTDNLVNPNYILSSGGPQSINGDLNTLSSSDILGQLQAKHPEEFLASLISVGSGLAESQVERYNNMRIQNEIGAPGADQRLDNATIDSLNSFWLRTKDFSELLSESIDLENFTDDQALFNGLQGSFLNIVSLQNQVETMIKTNTSINAAGQSIADLKFNLNKEFMSALALAENEDLAAATEIKNQIDNGSSIHAKLFNFEHQTDTNYSQINSELTAINNQISALDSTSDSYETSLEALEKQKDIKESQKEFLDTVNKRNKDLEINLARNLNLFTGRNANKLTDIMIYLETREIIIAQLLSLTNLDPIDTQEVKSLTNNLNIGNQRINTIIDNAGGNKPLTVQEARSLSRISKNNYRTSSGTGTESDRRTRSETENSSDNNSTQTDSSNNTNSTNTNTDSTDTSTTDNDADNPRPSRRIASSRRRSVSNSDDSNDSRRIRTIRQSNSDALNDAEPSSRRRRRSSINRRTR